MKETSSSPEPRSCFCGNRLIAGRLCPEGEVTPQEEQQARFPALAAEVRRRNGFQFWLTDLCEGAEAVEPQFTFTQLETGIPFITHIRVGVQVFFDLEYSTLFM